MAFGILKPHQGYWVRVLTATGAGFLVLFAAAWAFNQGKAVDLPPRAWVATLSGVDGELTAGDRVSLFAPAEIEGQPPIVIASASVDDIRLNSTRGGRLEIGGFDSSADARAAAEATLVRRGEPGAETFRASITGKTAVAVVNPMYVGAGAAGVILLVGAVVVYWFVAVNRSSVDFLINTDGEMKKVNWSTWREIRGSTVVVIVATFLIAALLFVVDLAFAQFFQLIDVLQTNT